MEAAKKTYHMACKEEKLAVTREANGKTEASVTPDQQKKLHEKVDKCKQDVQKVRRGSGMLTVVGRVVRNDRIASRMHFLTLLRLKYLKSSIY